MPRLVLEGYRGGVERTYIFQLADPWPDAQRPPGLSLEENRFGLLRSDLSRKPSFVALSNLMRVTDSDSAQVGSPGGLRLRLEGAGPDVRHLLLRSADGSYALALWRGVSVWDPQARRDLFPASNRLEVVLGDAIALARRFDPVTSDAEQQRWTDPKRIPIELGGAPVVVRLNPPGAGVRGGGTNKALRKPRRCGSRLGRTRPRCCSRKSRAARVKRNQRRATATWVKGCIRVRR
jgi:hypothetical protein